MALAVASGVDCISVALGLAAVLGNIAGPDAGLTGIAGDLVHPGMNLVVAARDHAPWRRLEEMLLGPVDACQRTLRGISRAMIPEKLDRLESPRYAVRTTDIVEGSKAKVFPEEGRPQPYIHAESYLSALRTPTFFLRQPDERTWSKALPEAMGASLFLTDDGRLFTDLLAKLSTKGPTPFATRIVAAATTGSDQFIERGRQDGPGRIDTLRAHLLITAGREQIRDALAADHSVLQSLLQNCVFVDPTREGPGKTLDKNGLRAGYEAYLHAVKAVVTARRNGAGYQIEAKPEILTYVDAVTDRIRTWCDDLPPRLRPYFSDSLSLPYRLCWAFSVTRTMGESNDWMLPFLWHVVQSKLWRQRRFLEKQMLAAEAAAQDRARQVMLQKLASIGPCVVRDLLRRYSNQRRILHQPVLDALVNEGKVRLRDDGRLELADAGRTAT